MGIERFAKNEIFSLVGGAPRYDLGESYGSNLRVRDILGGDVAGEFAELELDYGTSAGNATLRGAIASRCGVGADDVVITSGAMHALFLVAFVLCARDDEAVLTAPIFPPARAALDAIGVNVRTVALSFDRGYQLDPGELAALLTSRTRLVSLASPQNPSGTTIPIATLRDVLARMSEICPSAHLLVDDTYREATFGNEPVAPSAATLGPRVITVASLSKAYGTPGVRLGWITTTDAALREQFVLGKFNTSVSNPAIEELLARRVLEQGDRIMAERRREFAERRAMTQAWVETQSALVDWVKPDGGAICCVRLKPDVFDERAIENFHEELARHGARVARAQWFGDDPHVFRLGFARLPLADFQAALEMLTTALHHASAKTVA